jgi:hypothetical protein
MSEDLDPRLHPLRDDLAGAELTGRVERPRFAEARPAQVNAADGYMGYAPADTLRDAVESPTHWVRVPRSHVYPAPDEKAPPLDALPMTAQVRLLSERNRYSEVVWRDGSGWVPSGHLLATGAATSSTCPVTWRSRWITGGWSTPMLTTWRPASSPSTTW